MAKKFRVKTKLNAFDKFIIGLFKLFKGKHKLINLAGEPIEKRSIIVGIHRNASGPINYSMYFGGISMVWAAHQMTEKYRARWKYAYHTFYRQKIGYGKLKSLILATLLAFVAPLAYGIPGIIPVYYDQRVLTTFKYSMEVLNDDYAVVIFPEAAENGYASQIETVNTGFIELAKIYFKKSGIDVPIYATYLGKKPKKRIVIGKPLYYQELAKTYSDPEIAEIFRKYINSLSEIID